MPSFTRITTTAELPPLGARESPSLEFKAAPATARFELAKDVGGMASAYGGVIVVGAASDQTTEQLTAYVAFDEQRAAETIRAYEEAVRDRCSPVPLIDAVRIPHPTEPGFVVAVNINPVLDQPVGVRVNGDRTDGFGGAAYVFHARLSTHNVPLRPDQLPMLMNPEIRRTSILLNEIPGTKVRVAISCRHPRNQFNEDPTEWAVEGLVVDQLKNVVTMTSKEGGTIRIPLGDVEDVWEAAEGSWVIRVRGYMNAQKKSYVSNPRNAVFKV